jgi:hypothetical protein
MQREEKCGGVEGIWAVSCDFIETKPWVYKHAGKNVVE